VSYPPNPNGRFQAVLESAMSDTEQLVRLTVLETVMSVGEQPTVPVPDVLELEEQYEGNASCEDAT
jgi:hypothetical protein